jgi:hypothetical protein
LNTGVTFSSAPSTVLSEKADNIEYQLQERIPFTPFPDKIVGDIFDELGDLYATQQSIELAYIAYDFSLQYDNSDRFGAKKKMETLLPLLRKNKIPVPSWRSHYINRAQSEAVTKIATEVVDKISSYKEGDTKTFIDALDTFTGAKARREREKRQRTWYIIGGVALIGVLGVFVYRSRRK